MLERQKPSTYRENGGHVGFHAIENPEPRPRVELGTYALRMRCSTN